MNIFNKNNLKNDFLSVRTTLAVAQSSYIFIKKAGARPASTNY